MAEELAIGRPIAAAQPTAPARVRRGMALSATLRTRIALAGIAGISAFLGLYRLNREGFANLYYAAAVKSMLQNPHAFLFAAFDSQGFVSVDKPPAGLWIQAVFALVFGFHGWSLLLPQVLAAIGSIPVLFAIVRRDFGEPAALLAALTLAVSPITVAASRNNTSDVVLVFVLLLATWAIFRAADTGKARWLLLSMALVGLGFNIKMLEAYLVLPALLATYAISSGISIRRRAAHLFAAGAVLATVSFSWAAFVQLTPADKRPFVGSTHDNNVFSLIFGYNGLHRLLPNGWSIFGLTNGTAAGSGPFGLGVSGARENGAQSPFRLLNLQLGGQVGWLLPVAVIGFVIAWGWRPLLRIDARRRALVFWGISLLTQAAFFSVAGFYHRYYLVMVAPSVAALTGIGLVSLNRTYREGGWRILVLPAVLGVGIASQVRILGDYPVWKHRLEPASLIAAGDAIAAITLISLIPRLRRLGPRLMEVPMAMAAFALLAAPATWSGITIDHVGSGPLPAAGPATPFDRGGFGGLTALMSLPASVVNSGQTRTGLDPGNSDLVDYLERNQGASKYLLAVSSANEAAPIILATGKAVMAMGGFSGGDPILTVADLQQMIAAGEVRFFLGGSIGTNRLADDRDRPPAPAAGKPEPGAIPNPPTSVIPTRETVVSLLAWVQQNCKLVPRSTYHPGGGKPSLAELITSLYDCQGAVGAGSGGDS